MGLQDLVNKINKEFGGDTAFVGKLPPKERIPFSSPYLNHITYGGICYGASSEFVGAESSGKSTLVQDVIASFQKIEKKRYEDRKAEIEAKLPTSKGKDYTSLMEELAGLVERKTIFLDLEYTLDGEWMEKLGVDSDKVIILQPTAMGIEEPLNWIVEFASTTEIGLIAIDSVGSMISGAEEEKGIEERTYGGISMPLTRFYKKVTPYLKKNKIALIMVNQIRDDLVNQYNKFHRPGGRMHKFAQSLTLGLSMGERLDEKYASAPSTSEVVFARLTNVFVIKNKTAPPDRQRGAFCISYNHGVDAVYDTFAMACDMGLISANGAYYSFTDDYGVLVNKVQGKIKAINYLRENPDLYQKLWKQLYDMSTQKQEEDDE